MVVSSPLEQESSQGSLAVALILNKSGTIRMCQPQPPIATSLSIRGMREPWWHDQLKDIAIFNGKLYGLGVEEDNLSIFEMKYGHDGKPMISRVRCITRHPTERVILPKPLRASEHFITNYLVECCGRLLMVERKIECNHETGEYGPTAAFELFEADLSTKPGRWRCLSSLVANERSLSGMAPGRSLLEGTLGFKRTACISSATTVMTFHLTTVLTILLILFKILVHTI
jgi:hypothetical protein